MALSRFKVLFMVDPGHEVPDTLKGDLTRRLDPDGSPLDRQTADRLLNGKKPDGVVYQAQVAAFAGISWLKKLEGVKILGSEQLTAA